MVWYTGQFYALFFLIITLKLDYASAYILIAMSLLIGTPFFIVFGWLSDKIGRLKIILAGCLIAAVTYFPLFKGLTHYVNPALEAFSGEDADHRRGDGLQLPHLRRTRGRKYSDCDQAKDFLTKQGLSFKSYRCRELGDNRRGQDRQHRASKGWDEKRAARRSRRPAIRRRRQVADQLVR